MWGVRIVHWGTQENPLTLMPHDAGNVNPAKPQRWKVRPRAVGVTWERTAVPKVLVQHVPPAVTKTGKVKHDAKVVRTFFSLFFGSECSSPFLLMQLIFHELKIPIPICLLSKDIE